MIFITIFDAGIFYGILCIRNCKKDRTLIFPRSRSCPVPLIQKSKTLLKDRIMITIYFKDCNGFSQDSYNDMLKRLPLHQLECSCKKRGCLTRYGHYMRKIMFFAVLTDLIVQRLRCTECHRTHALIPSILVPYSRIPREDQQEILYCCEKGLSLIKVLERNPLVDENNVKHIVRQFRKHWKERILSIGTSLKEDLTECCLSVYSRQFMQIHRTWNTFFRPPTCH